MEDFDCSDLKTTELRKKKNHLSTRGAFFWKDSNPFVNKPRHNSIALMKSNARIVFYTNSSLKTKLKKEIC